MLLTEILYLNNAKEKSCNVVNSENIEMQIKKKEKANERKNKRGSTVNPQHTTTATTICNCIVSNYVSPATFCILSDRHNVSAISWLC